MTLEMPVKLVFMGMKLVKLLVQLMLMGLPLPVQLMMGIILELLLFLLLLGGMLLVLPGITPELLVVLLKTSAFKCGFSKLFMGGGRGGYIWKIIQ